MSLMQAIITTVADYPGLLCAFDFSQTDAQTLEAVSANGAISGTVTFPQGVTIGGDGVSLDGTQSAQFAGDSGDTPLTVLFIVTPTTADTFELYHNSYASRDTILSVEAGNPRFYYKSAYNNSENTINHTAAISLDKVNLIGFHTKNREVNGQYSLEFGLAGETGNRESTVFGRGPYHSYASATLFRSAFAGIANGMLVFDRQLTEAQIDEILYSLNIYGQISLPTNLNPDRFQSGAVLTAGRTIEGNFELAAGESTLSHFSTSQKGTPLEFVAFDTDEGGSIYKTAPLDPSTETELDFQAILGGAGGSANQTSKVSGVVQIDGNPAERTVRAFGYDPTAHQIDGETLNLSKSLGHATSDPETGAYTIDLLAGYDKRIFVVAFDDYGADFNPDKALSVGDRVHPTTPNGHVWECTGAGTLPSEEPTWIVDTETAQLYGTASMIAKPFYRPMVHGPVSPEVTLGAVNGDEYFNSVTLLTRFDGADGAKEATDLSNNTATITFGQSAEIRTDQSKFGGASLYLDGSSSSYVRTNRVQNIGTGEFTLEAWIRPAASNTMRIISSQDLVNTQAVLTLRVNSDGALACFLRDKSAGAPTVYFFSAPGLVAMDGSKWHHAALTRDQSSKLTLWLDGAAVASQTSNANPTGNSNAYDIGHFDISQERWTGHIDEVRITEGVCRYTADFAVPTEQFPDSLPQTGWSPASLFSNNEQGAWYDPSDLTTLFQDAAGTTPVSADGDPVGAMMDKSGNNLHAKQSGATLRPTYRTDGTKHWIEFDGSTVLTIDAPKADQRFMHDGTGLTCIGGYRFGSTSGEEAAFPIFGSDSGSSGKGGGFLSYDTRSQYSFSQSVRYFSTPVGSSTYIANMKVDNVAPVNTDCSFEFSASAEKTPNLEVLQDGAVVGSDDYQASLFTGDASYNYDIFAYGNGNGKTNGRLYGLLVINTILTRDAAAELTTFMKAKAGI